LTGRWLSVRLAAGHPSSEPTEVAMSLAPLISALPAYAADIGRNLSTLAAETVLTDQQKWGTFVASAHAVATPTVVKAIEAAAREAGLAEEALTAAKTAAAIMGMNNVYYRAIHVMQNPEYRTLRTGLRMNVLTSPGVAKADFELWELAVSAIHGCGACLDAHEGALKRQAVPATAIQAALRIAAVTHAVSRLVAGEEAAAA
jgi:alkyl hydroperoxide reductase subunit D